MIFFRLHFFLCQISVNEKILKKDFLKINLLKLSEDYTIAISEIFSIWWRKGTAIHAFKVHINLKFVIKKILNTTQSKETE